jgi:hypothetical protein
VSRGQAVVIEESGGLLTVRSPYEAKDIIKGFPGARWDGVRKCWIMSDALKPALVAALKADGFTVVGAGVRDSTPVRWADAMFSALPARLAPGAYRALSRVLHPDRGGDSRLMQQLNDGFAAR